MANFLVIIPSSRLVSWYEGILRCVSLITDHFQMSIELRRETRIHLARDKFPETMKRRKLETNGERECVSIESATALAQMKPVDSNESVAIATEDLILDIDEEFMQVLRIICKIFNELKSGGKLTEWMDEIDEVRAKREKLFHNVVNSKDEKFDNILACAISYEIMSYIWFTYGNGKENLYTSLDYCMKCIFLLRDKMLDRKVILTTVVIFNRLGVISLQLEKQKKSILFFNKALWHFVMYTKEDYPVPIYILQICNFDYKIDEKLFLIKQHAITLHYLTNIHQCIYSNTSRNNEKLLIYEHKFLCNNLNDLEMLEKYYINWVGRIADLSNYFILYKRFTEARHHLAAASFILQKYEKKYLQVDGEDRALLLAKHQLGTASVARSWAWYGIEFLNSSKQRLLFFKEYDRIYARRSKIKLILYGKQSTFLIFPNFEKDLEKFAVITDKYILNYNDAKMIFVIVLKYLEEVKKFNSSRLPTSMTRYVALIRNISKAYKYFAWYEQKENQIKLYKLRIKLLQNIDKMLNKTNIDLCRQIWVELTIIYCTLLDMKTDASWASEITAHEIEIDELVRCSIFHLQLYFKSLEISK